ncbi:hypothetical protein B4100_1972 [Heyndrickxia coagulans]|nr:hypothetical protein B4100_1972 [Heyndrickxia coagulans]
MNLCLFSRYFPNVGKEGIFGIVFSNEKAGENKIFPID